MNKCPKCSKKRPCGDDKCPFREYLQQMAINMDTSTIPKIEPNKKRKLNNKTN